MVLQRWDPFAEMRRMEDAINRMWSGSRPAGYDSGRWDIPLDVVQQDDDIVVRASMPGLNPDEINVTLEDGLLTIEGETSSETEANESDYLLKERRVGAVPPVAAAARFGGRREGQAELRERPPDDLGAEAGGQEGPKAGSQVRLIVTFHTVTRGFARVICSGSAAPQPN